MIEIDGLTKTYSGITAVDDFSVTIGRGEIYALVGPDGAGKTTIMRCLCNLVRPDRGRLSVAGKSLTTDSRALKSLVGYMPQSFSLYPDLSVEENLIFFAGINGITGAEYRRRRDRLYEFSRLAPFSMRRAGALSGGMKQKLALSCAVIHQPQLLILDEPTTGVDPLSRRQFWDILGEFRREGVTILYATPYMDEVGRAGRACFLHNGVKLAEGSPSQLTGRFAGNVFHLDILPTTDLISRLEDIEGIRARRFGSGVHLYSAGHADITALKTALARASVDSSSLQPMEASLEDCFMQLMEQRESNGRSMTPNGAAS